MGSEFTYYLGLDMGTDSLGWAVTDSSYHILRAKGKDLWACDYFLLQRLRWNGGLIV